LRIDHRMRRAYRAALMLHEIEGKPEPPNPFEPDGTTRFLEWLGEAVAVPALTDSIPAAVSQALAMPGQLIEQSLSAEKQV
jgi:hypothetical protein